MRKTGVSKHDCLNRAAHMVQVVGMRKLPPFAPYVLATDEVPAEFSEVDNCHAYTSERLDERLKMFLHEQGKWFGYHFATVVFLDRMASLNEISVTGLVLHEFGHAIESLAWAKATPEQREAAGLRGFVDEADGELRFHGAGWHRAVAHVGYRASQSGWRGGVKDISFAGETYGLSNVDEYWSALRREVDERRDEPLTHVLRSPLPADFAELWAADIEELSR